MTDQASKLSFQVSPIWLTGAPMATWPNKQMPIIAITDMALFSQIAGAVSTPAGQGGIGSDVGAVANRPAPVNLDDAFGAFQVLPGGTLVKQSVAQYPFANQYIAANATIFEPLEVSLVWDTPMRGANAWATRMNIIGKLQAALTTHNNSGGTYTVVTPSYIYTNMLLTNLSDTTRGTSPIPQSTWKFDFVKPMITMADITAAQSNLISKITAGVVTNGQWSGPLIGSASGALPQFVLPTTATPSPPVTINV